MQGRIARSVAFVVVLLILAVVVLVFADGGRTGAKVPVGADPRVLASERRLERTLTARRREVASYRRLTWSCQDRLGRARARASWGVWGLPRSLAARTWVRDRWARRYRGCKVELSRRSLPLTNDWQTAVRIVQRVYPGTAEWMLAISDREGGWGEWVWYGGGHWTGHHIGNDFLGADTVGGNMQFRYSTFAPYWRQAQADLARRGFILPELKMPAAGGDPRYVGWLSPLGQALTAGYMRYTGKDGCHWCL